MLPARRIRIQAAGTNADSLLNQELGPLVSYMLGCVVPDDEAAVSRAGVAAGLEEQQGGRPTLDALVPAYAADVSGRG